MVLKLTTFCRKAKAKLKLFRINSLLSVYACFDYKMKVLENRDVLFGPYTHESDRRILHSLSKAATNHWLFDEYSSSSSSTCFRYENS